MPRCKGGSVKKPVFALVFFIIAALHVSAQGFYFDIGVNSGISIKKIDGYYSLIGLLSPGLKAGFGPLGNIPIYVVGEYNYFVGGGGWGKIDDNGWGDIDDRKGIYAGDSKFVGAGVIYYPVPLIQLGLTLGWLNSATGYNYESADAWFGNGFGWNISAAVDLGKNNHGCLLGLKYFGAYNWLQKPYDKTMVTTDLGVFVKYAYRKQVPDQNVKGSAVAKQSRSNTGVDGATGRASKGLIGELPENAVVAVISISSSDVNVSTHIANELEFQLVSSKKFTVVDRNALDTIRREQNFQMSGEVSDSSAVSIGQMLGANIVITGSVTEAGKNQRLSLKALDVRTGRIITMAREDF